MPPVYWLIEKRVLVLKPEGEITEAAVQENFRQVRECMADGTHPMYLLIDPRDQTGILTPAIAHKLAGNVRENLLKLDDTGFKWTLLITKNMLARFAMSLLMQWMGTNMRAFDSRGEALDFLARWDESVAAALSALPSSP